MCFPSVAEGKSGVGKRAPADLRTNAAVSCRGAQPNGGSDSTGTHTHTHTYERAAVEHGHGMFRSGYTPSSWIPWMPPRQTWDSSPVSVRRCLTCESPRSTFHFKVLYPEHIHVLYGQICQLIYVCPCPLLRGNWTHWHLLTGST